MDIQSLMLAYFRLRGSKVPTITTGKKVLEEGQELVEAIARGDIEAIMHETADVVLTAAVVAQQFGFTVEHAIGAKMTLDAGKGEPKHDPRPLPEPGVSQSTSDAFDRIHPGWRDII
jgi:NTP pyrophosphatase (non-canonical NTP hydrolase)